MFDEDDSNLEIEGIEEVYVEGPEALNRLFGNIGAARSPQNFLGHIASMRVPGQAALPKPLIPTLRRMSKIASVMHSYLAEQSANELRTANQWVGVYTTTVAPGSGVDVTVKPAAGQATYHFLGFAAADSQCEDFGLSTLVVGGLPMILSGAQTAPTAPTTNAVPLVGMLLRESAGHFNINPYTGRDFTNEVPMTFRVENLTSDADAITRRCRLLIAIQADPCGGNAAASKAHAESLSKIFRKSLRQFARI